MTEIRPETNSTIAPESEANQFVPLDPNAYNQAIQGHGADDQPTDEAEDEDEVLEDDVEMSLWDHLEELRMRLFYIVIGWVVSTVTAFVFVNKIVGVLEIPAGAIKFVQLTPGEYFFVSVKVAGYSGLILSAPASLYQIMRFVLPGLTRKEKRLLIPIILGSAVLFLVGLYFSYIALIPAALKFFVSYGGDVVEQFWSIEKYFEFVLLLAFSTGLAFQIPVVQVLLGLTGIVSSQRMLSGWRYVILGSLVAAGILTPSTDPLTQSLLSGAIGALYFGGIGLVKLLGK